VSCHQAVQLTNGLHADFECLPLLALDKVLFVASAQHQVNAAIGASTSCLCHGVALQAEAFSNKQFKGKRPAIPS